MNRSTDNIDLILASASPRRSDLLSQMGLVCQVEPQNINENKRVEESPEEFVLRLAKEKALSALSDLTPNSGLPVLAADTIVVCNNEVMGKPMNLEDASRMLLKLSNNKHRVLTAVALGTQDSMVLELSETTVYFRDISKAEIEAYWQSGEPEDKAGSYAIQGLGAMFVKKIEGSYSNVVGLPMFETVQLLSSVGISCEQLMLRKANSRVEA